jgi:hypothetical protein
MHLLCEKSKSNKLFLKTIFVGRFYGPKTTAGKVNLARKRLDFTSSLQPRTQALFFPCARVLTTELNKLCKTDS